MVILPSAAEWKETPDIEEGAVVREDQVLLMMPDLSKMQVKVGIHESNVDRIKPGMAAKVMLPDATIAAEVSSVASVTRPAGWWTGNVVKYDTMIQLDSYEGLKPGMSAEVEVTVARHGNVVTIPVAAVVETDEEHFCWVKTAEGVQRRSLRLGDSNDRFIVVKAGVKEGDDVVLNPMAYVEEAETKALKPLDDAKSPEARGSTPAKRRAPSPPPVPIRQPTAGKRPRRPAENPRWRVTVNSTLFQTVQLGLKSLRLQKMRAGLAALGIFIGTTTVIWLVAMGEGVSHRAQQQILELGATNIIVRTKEPPTGSEAGQQQPRQELWPVTRRLRRIVSNIPNIRRAVPMRELRFELRLGNRTADAKLVGCSRIT